MLTSRVKKDLACSIHPSFIPSVPRRGDHIISFLCMHPARADSVGMQCISQLSSLIQSRARVAGHSNPTGKVYRALFEDRLVVVKVPYVDDLQAQLEEYNLLASIVR